MCRGWHSYERNPYVIPKSLKATVLTIGHEGNLGVVSMKQRLRTKVWWPKMEKDVEKFVKLCDACQLMSRPDPPEPLASTELPEGPWRAFAIDYLGPLPSGENILVAVAVAVADTTRQPL